MSLTTTEPLQADDAGGDEDEDDDAEEDDDDGEDEDGEDEEEEDEDDGREEYTDYGAILGGDADAYEDEVFLRWCLLKEIGLDCSILSCQAFNSITPCSAKRRFHQLLPSYA